MPHPAALPIDELLTECQVTRTRGSGPGGQHRNKTETAIVITHLPTGVRGEASERRSQAENLAQAKHRLQVELALAVRSEETTAAPSPLWQSRANGQRITVSTSHDDFPALLAEALDALDAANWAAPATAERLGVSTSQLVKFLQQEPRALVLLNRAQTERGLHPYR
ncbi:peptide chain release factor family protein [Lacipirellula parvula]|uniref:Prokaryotic-type class I peptide chain release factors domain-containing protein n=1 Tax=Lacipirellula parvula TaxID=2650471 RepID=A0A5K7X5L9_9BACT|nr:peptide chain release factor-like protein [Lacipirellula parvula]BBO32024.1 hypothetical protein PLANPX_1636 [Lacipirellula parvula]